MGRADDDDDDDDEFAGRSSVKQSIELVRHIRTDLAARTWRRNLVGFIFVVALVVAVFVIRH